MNPTRFHIGVTLLCLLSLLAGCSKDESNIEIINGQFSISKQYHSLDHVVSEATEVVEVEVLEQHVITHHQMPFTLSNVKVLASHKGSTHRGDILQVIETGGVYEPKLDGTDTKDGRKLELAFEGVRVMKPGENYFLALQQFHGPQTDNAYVAIGEIFGKFKLKSGQIAHVAPDKYKLQDIQPMNKSEFQNRLHSSIK